MAQKVQILLIDDIDGSDASETVSFGLDGVDYEIDVNEKNALALRSAVLGYAEHGRRLKKGSRKSPGLSPVRVSGSNSTAVPKHSAKEIRDWARTNGIDIPDRGRVPQEVRNQFEAAVG
jgi:hypothetical protein